MQLDLASVKSQAETKAEEEDEETLPEAEEVSDATIQSVLIAGRPEGLFGSDQKSHTTAWGVFVDGVRLALTGKTLSEAVGEIDRLYDDSKKLPGSKQSSLMSPENERGLYLLQSTVDDVRSQIGNDGATQLLVQRYVRGYLEYKNKLPLSAADTGSNPDGDAEARRLETIRKYQEHTKDEVAKAMLELLDARAWAEFGNEPEKYLKSDAKGGEWVGEPVGGTGLDEAKDAPRIEEREIYGDLPGADPKSSPIERLQTVLEQHLLALRSNFPAAYDYASIDGKAIARYIDSTKSTYAEPGKEAGTGAKSGVRGRKRELEENEQQPGKRRKTKEKDIDFSGTTEEIGGGVAIPGRTKARASGVVLGPQSPAAVEITLDRATPQASKQDADAEAAGVLFVSEVTVAGRPHGLFGSQHKSHSTAWEVFVDGVREAVVGYEIKFAFAQLKDLLGRAKQLTGTQRTDKLVEKRKKEYQAAETQVDAMAQRSAVPEAQTVNLLQNFILAYLRYRNLIPLSAVDIGRATGHGEAASIALLEDYENQPEDKIRDAMWALLDREVVDAVVRAELEDKSKEAVEAFHRRLPGVGFDAKDNRLNDRVSDLLWQHLETLEQSYPAAYEKAGMEEKRNVFEYLSEDKGWQDLFEAQVKKLETKASAAATKEEIGAEARARVRDEIKLPKDQAEKLAAFVLSKKTA